MSIATDEYARLAKDSYVDRSQDVRKIVPIGDAQYRIMDTVSQSTSGFQATAYQRIDTGEIVIAYRGTEASKDHLRDDKVDAIMVRDRTNSQLPDAIAFTDRVRAEAKLSEHALGHSVAITVTGHSLGGALAEINAARYKMGGETFNAYGAAAPDLSYGVPEGVPKDAPNVIGHVRATDVVSAGSRHYGSTVVYATEQDIEGLKAGRYLDQPNAAHPANPLLAASISAHFVDNFAPDPGKGPSVMSKENEARYHQYQGAIDHYRHDVLTSRINLTDVLNHQGTPAQAAQLTAAVKDAVGVAGYGMGVHKVESMLGVPVAEQALNLASHHAHMTGQVAQVTADATAHGLHVGGQAVQAQAEQLSHGAHSAGLAAQAAGHELSRSASSFAGVDPIGALGVSLGATAVGYVAHAEAEGLSHGAHLAGQATHAIAESMSHGLHSAGQAVHDVAESASQTVHGIEQAVARAAARPASTQAHDYVQDRVTHGAQAAGEAVHKAAESLRFDHPAHPGHGMYEQIHSYVRKIDAEMGRTPDQHSANLAGALTVAAKERGLVRADSVTPSDNGSRFFVSQTIIPRTLAEHAHVETAQAVNKPLEQSSAQYLQAPLQANALTQGQAQRQEQAQTQHQAQAQPMQPVQQIQLTPPGR